MKYPDDPKKSCFVIMPYDDKFTPVYEAIKEAVRTVRGGIDCVRAKELHHAGKISEDMAAEISGSAICVADLTGLNPNVMWEVGYAMALRRPTLLLSQDVRTLPFDIKDYRTIEYSFSQDREVIALKIASAIRETLNRPKPKEEIPGPAQPGPEMTPAPRMAKAGWIAAAFGIAMAALGGTYAYNKSGAQDCPCDLIHVANNNQPVHLVDDISVKLERIETLQGNEEPGDSLSGHEFNKRYLDREGIFEKVLKAASIPEAEAVRMRGMNQGAWDDFRKGLTKQDRRKRLTAYPFAQISVFQGKVPLIDAKYFFKGERLPEIKRDGAPPIVLELANLYNTQSGSGEDESVALRLVNNI